MLDLGWSEMAIIALLALLVIGPKDLPRVLRTLGQFMRKARSLSREFQSGLDEVMRESELDEARKAIEKTRPGTLDREIRKALDPDGAVDKELRSIDRDARDSVKGPLAGNRGKPAALPGQDGKPAGEGDAVTAPAPATPAAPAAAAGSAEASAGAATAGERVVPPPAVSGGADKAAEPVPASAAGPAAPKGTGTGAKGAGGARKKQQAG